MSKRKAAKAFKKSHNEDDSEDATVSLETSLLTDGNSEQFAQKLWTCLPAGAVMTTSEATTMLRAFDLVRSRLQHQTNLLSKKAIKMGKTRDILVANVALPPDSFAGILSYCTTGDLVHHISLVNKAWLAVARDPRYYHTLDPEHGLLTESKTVRNMNELIKLLGRRQFSSLKTLIPPYKVQMRAKALESIATKCPQLECLDLGYAIRSNMKVDDNGLACLPSLFPHLRSLSLNMYRSTDKGVAEFCRAMGSRLISLRIYESYACDRKLSDYTLAHVLGRHCPNLQRFSYQSWFNDNEHCLFTATGLRELLEGCRQLRHLSLLDTGNIHKSIFCYIANHKLPQDNSQPLPLERLFVMNHIDLMRDTELCTLLGNVLPSFEVIDRSTWSDVRTKLRLANRIDNDW
jgi:hypothetical protein